MQLRGRFDNASYHLVPGFYAKLSIDVGPATAMHWCCRAQPIQSDQQGEFAFRRRRGQSRPSAQPLHLPVAGRGEGRSSAAEPGEQVVVRGGNKLTDGEPVQIAGAEQAG